MIGDRERGRPVRQLHLDVDVSDAVDLPGPLHTRVTIVAPRNSDAPAVVAFGFPGGGYNRQYFDLTLALPGPGGSSEARWHADRGWWYVACDHLGVGDSSHPTSDALTFETLADANDATVRAVCAHIEAGTLDHDLPAEAVGTRLGFGQSMGGCLTIVAQARHRTFDGIGILGFSAIHTALPTPTGEIPNQPTAARGTADISIKATSEEIGTEVFGYGFHWDDVPRSITEADLAFYPLRDHAAVPVWGRGATPPPCAATMLSAGVVADEARVVDVPVLVAVGERDTVPDPAREAAAYPSSSAVAVEVVPRMAHMHNFAGTRELLWERAHTWGDKVASLTIDRPGTS
jgi:pimeloyl-ACP methyl ester carboxylesterase